MPCVTWFEWQVGLDRGWFFRTSEQTEIWKMKAEPHLLSSSCLNVHTHIGHFVEGWTSFFLPVGLGVKVQPVDPWHEGLFCDQVVDLPFQISHPVATTEESLQLFYRFNRVETLRVWKRELIPVSNLRPSSIICPFVQGECHWPSHGPLHSIQDFHSQGTHAVWGPMPLSQETRRQNIWWWLIIIWLLVNRRTLFTLICIGISSTIFI